MTQRRKGFIAAFLVYLVGQALFLHNLEHPRAPNFDETHYVPAARSFTAPFGPGVKRGLASTGIQEFSQTPNYEHPPLGKILLGLGIQLAGDNSLGWRAASTVLGALTLVAFFYFGYWIVGSIGAGLFLATLTLANQLLYVQSRIAMLDTYMFAFMSWGFLFAFRALISDEKQRRNLWVSGSFMGLAISCKWSAIFPWFLCTMFLSFPFFLPTHLRQRATRFIPTLPASASIIQLACALVLLPLGIYFLSYLPLAWQYDLSVFKIIPHQFDMWSAQLSIGGTHPYSSTWLSWPFLVRPIWYLFESTSLGDVRAVLLLGNPLVMFTGILSLGACGYLWLKRGSKIAFLAIFAFVSTYAFWVIFPRELSFYYYYYPSGMFLGLAVAICFNEIKGPARRFYSQTAFSVVAVALFLYFLPILGAFRIAKDGYLDYMWFRSWI